MGFPFRLNNYEIWNRIIDIRWKYPRTLHLPCSQSRTLDDRTATVSEVAEIFGNREVVITEKMDGEATTIYSDGYTHARSTTSNPHPSRAVIRETAAMISSDLPTGFRVCGENVYAQHSIVYTQLTAYFQVYNMWNEGECLSWDETKEWSELLGLVTVPELYRGPWQSESHAVQVWNDYCATLDNDSTSEGFVTRIADSFVFEDFSSSVLKYVRAKHVQTTDHWMHSEVVANSLR